MINYCNNQNQKDMTSLPPRSYNSHKKLELFSQQISYYRNATSNQNVLIGDSFIARLEWKHKTYSNIYFKDWVNFGIGGDKIENLYWRVSNGTILSGTEKVIICIGSNNIKSDSPDIIANTIIEIGKFIEKNYGSDVFICGQYPRENKNVSDKIKNLNYLLSKRCQQYKFTYLPVNDFFWKNGSLNENFFETDQVHLKSCGYKLFCQTIASHMYYKKIQSKTVPSSPSKENVCNFNVSNSFKQATNFNLNQSNFPPLPMLQSKSSKSLASSQPPSSSPSLSLSPSSSPAPLPINVNHPVSVSTSYSLSVNVKYSTSVNVCQPVPVGVKYVVPTNVNHSLPVDQNIASKSVHFVRNVPTREIPCVPLVQSFPLRKLNKVKSPKWEKCDYIRPPLQVVHHLNVSKSTCTHKSSSVCKPNVTVFNKCNSNVSKSISSVRNVPVCKPPCPPVVQFSPLRKLNEVKPPKWDNCDYNRPSSQSNSYVSKSIRVPVRKSSCVPSELVQFSPFRKFDEVKLPNWEKCSSSTPSLSLHFIRIISFLSVCGFLKFLKFLNILFNYFYFSFSFLFCAILRKSPNHDWKCRAFFISTITLNLLLLNIFVTKNISDCYFKKVDFDYSLSGPHIFDRHNNKIAITSSFYSINPFNKSNFNSTFLFDSYDESDFLQGLYNPCKYVNNFLPFFLNTIPFPLYFDTNYGNSYLDFILNKYLLSLHILFEISLGIISGLNISCNNLYHDLFQDKSYIFDNVQYNRLLIYQTVHKPKLQVSFKFWHTYVKRFNSTHRFFSPLTVQDITSTLYSTNFELFYSNHQMANLTLQIENNRNLFQKRTRYSLSYKNNENTYAILKLLFFTIVQFLSRKKKIPPINNYLIFLVIGISKILLFYSAHFESFPIRQLKISNTDLFFSVEILDLIDAINTDETKANLILATVLKLKCPHHASFHKFIILLSGDVNLHPGPSQLNMLWSPFKNKGLHFVHLNINSLFPKIDELREISKQTNAALIGISESKLDSSILNPEININGYVLLRRDRNRHGGGVACYIREDINYTVLDIFPSEIESIFIDILLPKTKPFTVGVFYRPPLQVNFLELVAENFDKLSVDEKEIHILGDLNINTLLNGKSILDKVKNRAFDSTQIGQLGKKYYEFCSNFSLKQLIRTPTRITRNSSTLIDHVLTNSSVKINNSGVIDTSLSDHQLIYFTRKLTRIKFNKHKSITGRSFKNYTPEQFQYELSTANFLNYETFDNIDKAYSDFSNKFINTINKVAPLKEVRIKNSTQDWFNKEIYNAITVREKNFNNFKISKSVLNEEIYKNSKYFVRRLIKGKKNHSSKTS